MKFIKTYFILFILVLCLPIFVSAGSLQFNQPEKVSNTSYKFTVTVQDINLNTLSGKINITNGSISNIVMSSGWVSKTGNSNSFYFYRNGVSTGNYTIATVYVTMTGNSEYKISDVNYGVHKCTKDIYGTYFDAVGNVVDQNAFQSSCGKSKDATLKSLSLSSGTLSPSFSSSLEIYSATVENSVGAMTFYPVTNHGKAKVISGTNCALKVGMNTCKLVVQAEAGNTKTYSITVIRKNSNTGSWTASNDASIKNLTISNGTLTSAFSSSKTEYDIKVGKDVNQIVFSFVMNSNGQSMKSDPCRITPDTSRCKLTVTAEDGVSTKTYSFRILHEGSTSGSSNNGVDNTTEGNTAVSKPNKNENNNNNNIDNPITNENSSSSSQNNQQNVTVEIDKEENAISNNEGAHEEQESNNYSENKEQTVVIPIINKEINATYFYCGMAVVTLILGFVLGFVLSKILKRIVHKK